MSSLLNMYGDPEHEWKNVLHSAEIKFALLTKAGKAIQAEHGSIYVCEKTGLIVAKFKKAHYAVGRVLQLISNVPDVAPGEYKIIDKEGWNYGYSDTLKLKRHIPTLDTARKAANWAEKQIAYAEAMDGLTTAEIVASMKVL